MNDTLFPKNIILKPIHEFIAYAHHSRTHSDAQITQIVASIKEFGFNNPILIDENNEIIAGHGRVLAAKKLSLVDIPCIVLEHLTETQKRAYRIADNKIALNADWDYSMLEMEVSRLMEEGFNTEILGFDTEELEKIIAETMSTSAGEDDVPIVPHNPVSTLGDIWCMGEHILICGDSTQKHTYDNLMRDGFAHMIVTDPPYNVAYKGKAGSIKNDDMSHEDFAEFLKNVFENMSLFLKAGGGVYVSFSEKESESFYKSLREAGLKQSSCLIWIKNNLVMGRGDYHSKHEPIWYGWKAGAKHAWYGGRKQTTINNVQDTLSVFKLEENKYLINIQNNNVIVTGENLYVEAVESNIIHMDKPQKSELHPTMKPVALIEQFIKNSSKKDNIVLDPFGGSGTTLIACEKLKRKARLIELDTHYCDVIVGRWQDFTGQKAYRFADNISFNDAKL